jgi:hypothetical protein
MTTNLLAFSITWFLIFSTFLMNVQLGQLFNRRDVVDHAAAIAADIANKTYCAMNESSSAAEQEAKQGIEPLIMTATSASRSCEVTVRPSGGGGGDEGATPLDVEVKCTFACNVPIGAQVMCKGGKVDFEAKTKVVALGCDGRAS